MAQNTATRLPKGSNARENHDWITRRMAELLVLSAEAEEYGYRDFASCLDRAAQALAEASEELGRLAALSSEARSRREGGRS